MPPAQAIFSLKPRSAVQHGEHKTNDSSVQAVCLPSFPKRQSKYLLHTKNQSRVLTAGTKPELKGCGNFGSFLSRTQSAPTNLPLCYNGKRTHIVKTKEYTDDNRNVFYNVKKSHRPRDRVVQLDDFEPTDDDTKSLFGERSPSKLSGFQGRKYSAKLQKQPSRDDIQTVASPRTSPLVTGEGRSMEASAKRRVRIMSAASDDWDMKSSRSFDKFPMQDRKFCSPFVSTDTLSSSPSRPNTPLRHVPTSAPANVKKPGARPAISYYTMEPAYEDVHAFFDSLDYNVRTEQLLQYYSNRDKCFMCQSEHSEHSPVSVYKRSLMSQDGLDRQLVASSLTSPRACSQPARSRKKGHRMPYNFVGSHVGDVSDPLEECNCFIQINKPKLFSPRNDLKQMQ